ncbi:DUF2269 family protein [Bacillus sp. CGMCC 1.16607]|uniref:DUF2269 family protein n=1 Tax=Bacillus sp. CGMCC 1.16607 TaxID=3351842 RepID=UPI003636D6AB
MTVYGFIVLVHVIAAVVGLGSSFAMPTVLKGAKTAEQARYSIGLNKKIETTVKIGSIALLLTGLILGVLNTELFTKVWYITSIIIYLAVQVIVAGIMPKKIKRMEQVIHEYTGEDLPEEFTKINLELKPYNAILHTSAVILIILMSLKPF